MRTNYALFRCFAAALLGMAAINATGQQLEPSRAAERERIRREVATYVEHQLTNASMPNIQMLEPDEEEVHTPMSSEQRAHLQQEWARQYWRAEYFRLHPEAAGSLKSFSGSVCTHGDFEEGITALDYYEGANSTYTTGNCSAAQTLTFTTLPDFSDYTQFKLTNMEADPIIAEIPQTNDNSAHAIRINAPKRTPSQCGPGYGYGIDRLTKRFVLEQPEVQVAFYYALVLENPYNHDLRQPFFYARALSPTNVVLDDFCKVSDANDPFFEESYDQWTSDGCTNTPQPDAPIVYAGWTCTTLDVSGSIGDTIRLEFYTADCGKGGHFGYSYVDDICTVCNDPITGLVEFLPYQYCISGSTQVCGTYVPPVLNGVTGVPVDLNLTILQNGVPVTVGDPAYTVNTTNHTFCFTVSPANFPSTNGAFDFEVSMTFDLGNTVDNTNTTAGPNNDALLGTSCCPVVPTITDCDPVSGDWAYLNWTEVPGASVYQVQITTFSQTCCPGNIGTPQTFTFNSLPYDPSLLLQNANNYPCASWRVRAQCVPGQWTAWSDPQCLCIDPYCAPGTVTNLQCSNTNGAITVSWTGLPYAMAYEVEVRKYTCAGCTPTGIVSGYTYTTPNTTFTLPLPQSYYPCAVWRVRAICTDNTKLAWTSTSCLCVTNGSGCTSMIGNGAFESSTNAGPVTTCMPGVIPNWKPYQAGFNGSGSKIYVPQRGGTDPEPFKNFPSTKNPETWDAGNTANTRYLALYCNNLTFLSANTTGRAGIWQALSPTMVNAGEHFLRVRYAAYHHQGTAGSTFSLSATFSNATNCAPSGIPNQVIPLNSSMTISNSLAALTWNTVTIPITANNNYTAMHIEARPIAPSYLKANSAVVIYVDQVELVRYNCPMDLNGDGLINTSDIIILNGYMGSGVNQILNICHAGADANNDGTVTSADMDLFIAAFGTVCGGGMVLEPEGGPQMLKNIEDETLSPASTVLPNPTTGRFTLFTPTHAAYTPVQIYSADGRLIHSLFTTDALRMEIDLSDEPAGMYTVLLSEGDKTEVVRIIKE
jgi:hypothetical protein